MGRESDHVDLANRNHATLLYLIKEAPSHPEWVATVAFYKAVHVVEAVFAEQERAHSNGHDSRISNLKRPKYKDVFLAYRPLYAASLVARYLEDSTDFKVDGKGPTRRYTKFDEYIQPDRVVDRLIRKRLDVLEQHCGKFLSENARQSLKKIAAEPGLSTPRQDPPATSS